MICPGCGRKIDENALECPYCGYSFDTSYNVKSETVDFDEEDTAEFVVKDEELKKELKEAIKNEDNYNVGIKEEREEDEFNNEKILAWFVVKEGGKIRRYFRIKSNKVFIGNSDEAEIKIDELRASRIHAFVFTKEGKFYIEDLKTIIGTYLRGEKLTKTMELRDGDVVKIGDTELIFVIVKDILRWMI